MGLISAGNNPHGRVTDTVALDDMLLPVAIEEASK